MTDTLTKGYIFKEDLSIWDGISSTGSRKTSTGGTQILDRFDWVGIDVASIYGNKTNAELNSAADAVGSNNASFWLSSGEWTVTSNLTLQSNIGVKLASGATINISNGVTLTINGYFDAPNEYIFTGSGSVVFGGRENIILGDWFGSNKNRATLNNMVTVLGSSNNYLVSMSATTWTIDDDLTITSNFALDIRPGTIFNISATKTMTINGQFRALPIQLFSGTGSLVFDMIDFIYADWFGSARDKTCLSTMLTLLGTSNAYEIILTNDSTWDIDDDLDLSSNGNLHFTIPNGCIFSVAAAKTLTFLIPEQLTSSKINQIFTGSGTIAFDFPGIVHAEWWGAVGDGTTDDSTAIQAAINVLGNSTGGIVQFLSRIYACANLEMKSYVTLRGISPIGGYTHAAGVKQSYQTVLLANDSGDIVGTPATNVTGICIENIGFVGLGSGTAVKGIYLDDCDRGNFRDLSFDNLADQAIRIDEGAANSFSRMIAINCLLNTTRAAKIGVMDIGGLATDNFFDQIESTPSLSALTDANLYICAWAFQAASASTNFITNCIGEYADIGFYIAADWNRFIACRADLNYGHGFQLASTAGTNIFTGCLALRNSQDNDNTYDGYNIADGASGNIFNGCISESLGSDAWQQQYGYNNANNSSNSKNFFTGCCGESNQTGQYYGNAYLGDGFPITSGWKAFTADDATPSVAKGKLFWFDGYTGATDITDFDDATPGQEIRVMDVSATGFITIKNNANIATNTGADKNIAQNNVHTFVSRNGVWYEIE